MKTFILAVVKFCEKEQWADDFLNGRLYMNRLSYFKETKETEDDARADPYEGTAAIIQKATVEFNFKDHPALNVGPPDLVDTRISLDYHNDLHIFCMTAIHTGKFDFTTDGIPFPESELESLRKQCRVNSECLKLGNFAIALPNTGFPEFRLRVVKALTQAGYGYNSGLVEYYDPATFNGRFQKHEIPFRKRLKYAFETEFRIVVNTRTTGKDHLVIDIGNISDIVFKVPAKDVPDMIQLNMRVA